MVAAALLTALVFAADVATGSELSVSFFYLLPVALAAWRLGLVAGLAFSAVCAVGWTLAYYVTGAFASHSSVLVWNACVEGAVFMAVAAAIDWARSSRERERATFRELESAHDAFEAELRSVGDLQRHLLPPLPAGLSGYDIAVRYATSSRAGGDYYDFLPSADRLGVVVADASGHGSPAALLMGMARLLFRNSWAPGVTPGGILTRVHASLIGNAPAGAFVTACCLAIDVTSGRIEYALAGHPRPLVSRAGPTRVEALDAPDGPPLGVLQGPHYTTCASELGPGDSLFVYTDGLSEAMDLDGVMFGEERVRELLACDGWRSADDLCESVTTAVREHSGRSSPEDDITIVAIRRRMERETPT